MTRTPSPTVAPSLTPLPKTTGPWQLSVEFAYTQTDLQESGYENPRTKAKEGNVFLIVRLIARSKGGAGEILSSDVSLRAEGLPAHPADGALLNDFGDYCAACKVTLAGYDVVTGSLVFAIPKDAADQRLTLTVGNEEASAVSFTVKDFAAGATSTPIPTASPVPKSSGRIAFIVRPAEDAKSKKSSIYVINASGTDQTLLAEVDKTPNKLSWSPDGRRLIFQAGNEAGGTQIGDRDIWTIDVETKTLTNLTNKSGDDRSPQWSPDGQHIVFVSRRDGSDEIYIMDADGKNPRNLTRNPARDYDPAWSPDGQSIVFVSTRGKGANFADEWGDLYIMKADGVGLRRLTDSGKAVAWTTVSFTEAGISDRRIAANSLGFAEPGWSPDGKTIFANSYGERVTLKEGIAKRQVLDFNWDVFSIGLDSGEIHRLTTDLAYDWDIRFSPDGKQILVAPWFANVYVMEPDGSHVRTLSPGTRTGSAAWSPDGQYIAMNAYVNKAQDIYVVNADGSQMRRLTNLALSGNNDRIVGLAWAR